MIVKRTRSADCYPRSLIPVLMRSVHPAYRKLFTGLVLISLSCGCSSSTTSSDNERVNAQTVETANKISIASTPHQKWQSLDNPSRDGWSSEAFADAATNQLKQLGKWIQKPGTLTPKALDAVALPRFRCSPLLPESPQTVFNSPLLIVSRSGAESLPDHGSAFEGPAGLGNAIQQLCDRFSEARDIRTKFKIFNQKVTKIFLFRNTQQFGVKYH